MRIDDMDEATVQYANGYGEWQYQQGYEAGKKDAVKHGRWVLRRASSVCNDYVCSNCGYGFGTNSDVMPNYCSECGAKMDEKPGGGENESSTKEEV